MVTLDKGSQDGGVFRQYAEDPSSRRYVVVSFCAVAVEFKVPVGLR